MEICDDGDFVLLSGFLFWLGNLEGENHTHTEPWLGDPQEPVKV